MKASAIKYYVFIFNLILGFLQESKAQKLSVLVPQYAMVQYAGSIGYLSVGAGYNLFKNNRGSLEFCYGRVPESKGGPLDILSSKFAYRPFKIKINDKVEIYPVNPGAFFSYHFGEQFDISFDNELYIQGYYKWSTAIRGHLSISNEIKLFNANKKVKSVTLYSEFNAADLYLASLFYKNNQQLLGPADIIKLGLGVKVGF